MLLLLLLLLRVQDPLPEVSLNPADLHFGVLACALLESRHAGL
jgi:hypothetical protein